MDLISIIVRTTCYCSRAVRSLKICHWPDCCANITLSSGRQSARLNRLRSYAAGGIQSCQGTHCQGARKRKSSHWHCHDFVRSKEIHGYADVTQERHSREGLTACGVSLSRFLLPLGIPATFKTRYHLPRLAGKDQRTATHHARPLGAWVPKTMPWPPIKK